MPQRSYQICVPKKTIPDEEKIAFSPNWKVVLWYYVIFILQLHQECTVMQDKRSTRLIRFGAQSLSRCVAFVLLYR